MSSDVFPHAPSPLFAHQYLPRSRPKRPYAPRHVNVQQHELALHRLGTPTERHRVQLFPSTPVGSLSHSIPVLAGRSQPQQGVGDANGERGLNAPENPVPTRDAACARA